MGFVRHHGCFFHSARRNAPFIPIKSRRASCCALFRNGSRNGRSTTSHRDAVVPWARLVCACSGIRAYIFTISPQGWTRGSDVRPRGDIVGRGANIRWPTPVIMGRLKSPARRFEITSLTIATSSDNLLRQTWHLAGCNFPQLGWAPLASPTGLTERSTHRCRRQQFPTSSDRTFLRPERESVSLIRKARQGKARQGTVAALCVPGGVVGRATIR